MTGGGASTFSELQTAIQAMKVIGPQDYSGDINVTVSARAAESGVDPSPYASGNFKVSLTAVAEAPTLSVSNITDAVEDTAYHINPKITNLDTGGDASEAIISIIIQGLNFTKSNGVSYSAAIIDGSGNSVGIPDGSGGVTLTKAQYDAGVYLKSPSDFFGVINSISVSAVSRDTSDDGNSNSTATTVVENISFTVAPQADNATLFDLVNKSIAEYVSGTAYAPQSLGMGIVIPEQDTGMAETFSAEIWLPQKNSVYATLTKDTEVAAGSSATDLTSLSDVSSRIETVSGLSAIDGETIPDGTYKVVTVTGATELAALGDVKILPPVGFTGSDTNSYNVFVKGLSTTPSTDIDGNSVTSNSASTLKKIDINVLEVAKAPTVQKWTDSNSNNQVDDGELTTFNSGDSIGYLVLNDSGIPVSSGGTDENSTIDHNDYIGIPIQVNKVGANDSVTVLVTGLPSDDYSFRLGTSYSSSTVAGARNETGEVVLFQLSDFQVDGTDDLTLFVDYTAWQALNSQGKITIPDSSLQDQFYSDLSLNLTAFAVDGSGFGTTAQTAVGLGMRLKSATYPGDPIVIDFGSNGLEDNFSSNITSALIDLNNDSQKDNVYWLTNDSGLLVYDVSEGNSFADDTLSMSSNVFSEYFSLDLNSDGTIEASEIGGSSFGALLLLDSNNDFIISGSELSNVNVWRDLDADGTVDAGELSSVSSANLTNVQVTGEQITSGDKTLATSLRKASITTETGDFDMYEVGLGYEAVASSSNSTNITPAEYVFWVDSNSDSVAESSEIRVSKYEGLSEGGLSSEAGNTDLANIAFSLNNTPTAGTSLISIRGLPDVLSLNKGAKTSTGDWLLTTSDLEGVKILDTEENFSGDFALTLWTTTTVGAESAVSTSSKMIVSVNPVADDPNLKVRANIVGDEDSGRDAQGNVVTSISEGKPIPLPLRFEIADPSETISINVKLTDANGHLFLGLSS